MLRIPRKRKRHPVDAYVTASDPPNFLRTSDKLNPAEQPVQIDWSST